MMRIRSSAFRALALALTSTFLFPITALQAQPPQTPGEALDRLLGQDRPPPPPPPHQRGYDRGYEQRQRGSDPGLVTAYEYARGRRSGLYFEMRCSVDLIDAGRYDEVRSSDRFVSLTVKSLRDRSFIESYERLDGRYELHITPQGSQRGPVAVDAYDNGRWVSGLVCGGYDPNTGLMIGCQRAREPQSSAHDKNDISAMAENRCADTLRDMERDRPVEQPSRRNLNEARQTFANKWQATTGRAIRP